MLAAMALLARVVVTSERVAATRARLAKVAALAELLRALAPDELEVAVHFLSGTLPQGRFGVGWRGMRERARGSARE